MRKWLLVLLICCFAVSPVTAQTESGGDFPETDAAVDLLEPDPEPDVPDLLLKAEAGDVLTQSTLAQLYFKGEGVDQDYKEAFKWAAKAAAKGEPVAQFYAAEMYAEGNGVNADAIQAKKWYLSAAMRGYFKAYCRMAERYEAGEGLPHNLDEAFHWYRKGAQNNDLEAMRGLAAMYESGVGVAKNQKEADNWYAKADAIEEALTEKLEAANAAEVPE